MNAPRLVGPVRAVGRLAASRLGTITLEIAMTNFFNRINRTVREQAGKTW